MELFDKKKIITVFLLVLLWGTVNPVYSETEKERDIKRLLEVSGILDRLSHMQESLLNNVSMMVTAPFPKVPDAFWGEFNQLIGKKEMDDLIDRVIPVYDKHMSHETIKKLITMFKTPFWDEWKEKMPQISREAGVIGSEWGREHTQSEAFNKKLQGLIKKYELEKLNPT
ncbi:MAG: DUF2059 domain-containing protein, partial [Nitrospinota bacterium]|nr:DUF2059 domain-containing protein [Nitrospinota bacterium]